jgi:hypothetical protein
MQGNRGTIDGWVKVFEFIRAFSEKDTTNYVNPDFSNAH